ncbi:MAG: NADH-ubiquinone oxidoreductase-F iron-sulfur binding region domain-containing protein [Bacteroidota bacterium]
MAKNTRIHAELKEIVQLEKVEYSNPVKALIEKLSREKTDTPLISVSSGTAAMVAGADDTVEAIREYMEERNVSAEIVRAGCLGICDGEPVMSIQMPGRARVFFRNVARGNVPLILDDVFHNSIPDENVLGQIKNGKQEAYKDTPFLKELDFFRKQNRIILAECGIIDPASIEEYIAKNGYKAFIKTIRHYTYHEICDIVEESGLRGRSGSGFLTGTKWKIAYAASADQKYLVCNAEESDPGAFMDRAIMEGNPHMLLEGICIAAYAIGAARAYIYIRSEYTRAIQMIEHAIRRAYDYGLLGHNIYGSGFNLDVTVRKGPGAFVCGEETALIKSLEGRRGMPKSKPPYPATSGLHKMPTIINNVETLSNVPYIIGKGPKKYKSIGAVNNYGTKIFAISGKARFSGLVEVELGTSLRELIFGIAGGVKKGDLKGIQIGGPTGFFLPENEMDLNLTFEDFTHRGMKMGSGGIVVINEEVCILDMVKYYMTFMEKQSCGKCIPCREGTRRMSEILESITRKPIDDSNPRSTLERFKGVMQLESLSEVMKDTSLCGLGQHAPNPVLSTLRYFRDEYEEHIFDRKCRANVCTELRTYYIDVDLCTGCSVCAKKCPADAIIGTSLHPYFIVQEKCIGCGICYESCKFSAIKYN